MLKPEFEQWFQIHGRMFPGIQDRLEKLSAEARAALLAAWQDVLSNLGLDECTAASRAMLAEGEPVTLDRTPGRIRKLVYAARAHGESSGDDASGCTRCGGSGWVAWKDDKGRPQAGLCVCPKADWLRSRNTWMPADTRRVHGEPGDEVRRTIDAVKAAGLRGMPLEIGQQLATNKWLRDKVLAARARDFE